jgi:dsRNA-specific ribonuclease
MLVVEDTELKQWEQSIRIVATRIVSMVQADLDPTPYLAPDNMKLWERAFTHESYDYTDNYEQLELFGDTLLSAIAVAFFIKHFPQLKSSGLSEMKNYYTSGPVQTKMLIDKRMNLNIRAASGTKAAYPGIYADVFESIFGATYYVFESVSISSGYFACTKLFNAFYLDLEFDLNKSKGNNKTRVDQIFKRFYNVKPIQRVPSNKGSTITLYLLKEHYDIMIKNGITDFVFKPNSQGKHRLASATAVETHDADEKAYQIAFDILKKVGVTNEWSNSVKFNEDLKLVINSRESITAKKIRKAMRLKGHTSFEFIPSRKISTDTRKFIMLVATKEDGSKEIAASVEGGMDTSKTKAELVSMYISRSGPAFKSIY